MIVRWFIRESRFYSLVLTSFIAAVAAAGIFQAGATDPGA
jgi:hypothetical protein